MDVQSRLTALAKITEACAPVVSVYLNTHWTDEHQRDRVRVFLKREIARAREGSRDRRLDADLDWVEAQAESLVNQTARADARGVALFACQARSLREVVPVRVAFEDTFIVAPRPFIVPLATVGPDIPPAMVVFVDGESARLIPVEADGPGEEVRLTSEVPGHHRRGGWALLAQSRYQRHIQDHRDRHLDAVAAALIGLGEERGATHIVLAGEPRTVTALQQRLPEALAARVVGSIAASKHEAAGALVTRALEALARRTADETGAAVEAVLTDAAKGGQSVAGINETLEAVGRGAVHRLYLHRGFREPGRVCAACGTLGAESLGACPLCGQATSEIELGEAMVARVIAAGGAVVAVDDDPGLKRVGGVAARLRYPL